MYLLALYMGWFNTKLETMVKENIDKKSSVLDATYTTLISVIHLGLRIKYLQKVNYLERNAMWGMERFPIQRCQHISTGIIMIKEDCLMIILSNKWECLYMEDGFILKYNPDFQSCHQISAPMFNLFWLYFYYWGCQVCHQTCVLLNSWKWLIIAVCHILDEGYNIHTLCTSAQHWTDKRQWHISFLLANAVNYVFPHIQIYCHSLYFQLH